MKYLLLAIALLFAQGTFAADSTKMNKVKKEKVEVVKADNTTKAKPEKGTKSEKAETISRQDAKPQTSIRFGSRRRAAPSPTRHNPMATFPNALRFLNESKPCIIPDPLMRQISH